MYDAEAGKSIIELEKAKGEFERLSIDLEAKLKKRTAELSILHEVSNAISYTLDYKTLLMIIMESLSKIIDYDICGSLLFDATKTSIAIRPVYSGSAIFTGQIKESLFNATADFTSEPIREKQVSVVIFPQNTDATPKDNRQYDKLRSTCNIPFIVNGKVIGMINVSSCSEDAFSGDDMKLIYTIANQASNAIDRLHNVITSEKSKMESMVKSMSEGVIMIDEQGGIAVLNPKSRQMLGFNSPGQINERQLIEKMNAIGLYDAFQECQNKGMPISKDVIVANGEEEAILRCEITQVKEANDNAIGILTVLRDVTREKEIDKMKTEFVSTVSHELRTPLATMKEFISIISDEIAGKLTKEQREYVDIIRSSIDRLARMISNLLDISKIEAGKIELKKIPIDLIDIAKATIISMKTEAAGKHIEIAGLFPEAPVGIYADPDKITQILTNLIGNAIKFTPEKGNITVEVKDAGEYVECSVADTGRGIGADDMGKLFTKFQQFGRVPGAGEKGTGLGLAISKELVELHHGKMRAESNIGLGSKFTFSLPKKSESEFLKETLKLKVSQALGSGEHCALLVIQILNFTALKKELDPNDFMRLSAVIKNMIAATLRRKEDILNLIRDDKIAVIVNTKKSDDIAVIVDRLRLAFEKKLFLKKNLESKVEFSIGMATYGKEFATVDSIIEMADKERKRLTMPIIGKRDIVVVDDEKDLLAAVKGNLESLGGFRVHTYFDAQTALEEIVRIKPDLVVTDILMPKMNGYELIGRLREHEGCAQIPVILITGYSFDDEEIKKVKFGRIAKLSKPFDTKKLLDKIDSVSKQDI